MAELGTNRLSDAEFGRRWAAQQGARLVAGRSWHDWLIGSLPAPVVDALPALGYPTAARAYAALGRAVRGIQAAVPPLEV